MDDEEYALLSELIRERFGLEFPSAQRDRVRFRLRYRLEARTMPSFLEYYRFLALSPDARAEMPYLAEALTNNETYFFREAYQFHTFFENEGARPPSREAPPLKLLSAGCSSGEEAYSLAIAWFENAFRFPGRACEIEAFDLSPAKVREAKEGAYGPSSFRFTSPEARERYFTKADPKLKIKPWLQKTVRFRVLNMLELGEAFPPGTFDAVFCRNVLIYFGDPVIARLAGLFHKLLKRDGALFLGHSESLLGKTPLFRPERGADFIYYRKVSCP
jgi:chemotaxis protein methyltransferase CheR